MLPLLYVVLDCRISHHLASTLYQDKHTYAWVVLWEYMFSICSHSCSAQNLSLPVGTDDFCSHTWSWVNNPLVCMWRSRIHVLAKLLSLGLKAVAVCIQGARWINKSGSSDLSEQGSTYNCNSERPLRSNCIWRSGKSPDHWLHLCL